MNRSERFFAQSHPLDLRDLPFTRWLFNNVRSAPVWLIVRLWLGYTWLMAGLEKAGGPGWIDGGSSLKSYWERAVVIPKVGKPPINYDWWRQFLLGLIEGHSYEWFAWLIVGGEIAVGVGLLVGSLTAIAAFFGLIMNVSYLLSGSVSSNPLMLLAAVFLIAAWKVAGWWGVDRYLLSSVGTPWQPGSFFRRNNPPGRPNIASQPSQ